MKFYYNKYDDQPIRHLWHRYSHSPIKSKRNRTLADLLISAHKKESNQNLVTRKTLNRGKIDYGIYRFLLKQSQQIQLFVSECNPMTI